MAAFAAGRVCDDFARMCLEHRRTLLGLPGSVRATGSSRIEVLAHAAASSLGQRCASDPLNCARSTGLLWHTSNGAGGAPGTRGTRRIAQMLCDTPSTPPQWQLALRTTLAVRRSRSSYPGRCCCRCVCLSELIGAIDPAASAGCRCLSCRSPRRSSTAQRLNRSSSCATRLQRGDTYGRTTLRAYATVPCGVAQLCHRRTCEWRRSTNSRRCGPAGAAARA